MRSVSSPSVFFLLVFANSPDYDAREIQNPPKRRKTTSGPLPRPAAEYNLNTLNTYSQYQDEATYVPMRTRGGEDTCEEKGFGKERKWWHRVSRSNGLQVRKKKTDPWRKYRGIPTACNSGSLT